MENKNKEMSLEIKNTKDIVNRSEERRVGKEC